MKYIAKKNKKKIIVAMSGGVDSSVCAWLLKQQGYYIEGLFMKNWEEDDNSQHCNAKKDLDDTKKVCNILGITLHTVNFAFEYWNNVFKYFLKEYELGRTPNPDILCNKEIKFKIFLDFAINNLGADYIATGHYVRRINTLNKILLLRGIDNNKDQSYFLYTLGYKQLIHCLFPIGNLYKTEVRRIATMLNLPNANKKDSTGICFIGKRKFRPFLEHYLYKKPGKIISVNGIEMGSHKGLMYYTLGQRKGIGIGGVKNSNNNPWYVVDKDLEKNFLIVAQGRNHPQLFSSGLIATELHWIEEEPLILPFYCTLKARYQQSDINCKLVSKQNGLLYVVFEKYISSITPGQSVVFYSKERCLGGGVIKQRQPIYTLMY